MIVGEQVVGVPCGPTNYFAYCKKYKNENVIGEELGT